MMSSADTAGPWDIGGHSVECSSARSKATVSGIVGLVAQGSGHAHVNAHP
ncbi:MAG: hypothetical protein KBE65_03255 [Phycisphaerae bacterium]|nr:hypothetical protein [Phycisphaerae bacterium]